MTKKIEEYKQKYVTALKELERDYKIPALMLAGIAYMEIGGDPPIKNYGALTLRKVTNIFGPVIRPLLEIIVCN